MYVDAAKLHYHAQKLQFGQRQGCPPRRAVHGQRSHRRCVGIYRSGAADCSWGSVLLGHFHISHQSPRLRSGTGQLYHRTLCRTVHRERKGIECSEEQRFSGGHFGYHLCGAGNSAGTGGAEIALQTAQGGRSHWFAAGNAAGYRAGHRHHAVLEPDLRPPAAVQHHGHHGSGLCGAVFALYGAVCHLVFYPDQ